MKPNAVCDVVCRLETRSGVSATTPSQLIVYQRKRPHCIDRNATPSKKAHTRKKTQLEEEEGLSGNQPPRALTAVKGSNAPWSLSASLQRDDWGQFKVGTSGYVYKDWKSIIYPEGVSPKQWFSWYTKLFDTVEINNTFYRLPSIEVMDAWRSQAPTGFLYALKFSRFGTHMKRLKDPEGPISLFLDRAARLGEDLIGPILVQLPPKFDKNLERLKDFLEKLPQKYRWAIELRDARWLSEDVYALLREYHTSICIHDHKDINTDHPKVLTTNWVYIRFHGHDYRSRYNITQLQAYADWIRERLARGVDVYAYFNNDYSGHAPYNALELRELVFRHS